MTWSAAELATLLGGKIVGSPRAVAKSFWTDTRDLRPGEGFIALVSETGDGHRWISDAFRKDAPVVIANRPPAKDLPPGKAVVLVNDSWKSLETLSAAIRRSRSLKVAAITGTNGKTGVKELSFRLLDPRGACKTDKNYNNRLGIAWTLFRLPDACRTLVAEIGMNHRGEIDTLAGILKPSVGVITAVRPVHLQYLGSAREVAEAKAELIPHIPSDGLLIYNRDDSRAAATAAKASCPTLSYGLGSACDLRAVDPVCDEGGRWSFGIQDHPGVRLTAPLPGRFWIHNSLAAWAVGRAMGASTRDLIDRWPSDLPLDHRLRVHHLPGDIMIVDDSYNANPVSIREALFLLESFPRSRRLALLGEMAELGPKTDAIHYHLGTWIGRKTSAIVYGVGKGGIELAKGVDNAAPGRGKGYQNLDAAVKAVAKEMTAGDVILVKGSRLAGMDKAVIALRTAPVREA